MASINCKCGSVRIKLKTTKALYRLECCCYDCTAALRYADTKRGGPKSPDHQVVDSIWFPNDFSIEKGKTSIGAFKNFASGDTVRFYCKHCWTVLFADLPILQGRILLTQINSYKEFKGLQDAEIMQPTARHMIKDLSRQQVTVMPAFQGSRGNVYWGAADNFVTNAQEIIGSGSTGTEMNMQFLLAKIGAVFIPDDDPRLVMGPPTLMTQIAAAAEKVDAQEVSVLSHRFDDLEKRLSDLQKELSSPVPSSRSNLSNTFLGQSTSMPTLPYSCRENDVAAFLLEPPNSNGNAAAFLLEPVQSKALSNQDQNRINSKIRPSLSITSGEAGPSGVFDSLSYVDGSLQTSCGCHAPLLYGLRCVSPSFKRSLQRRREDDAVKRKSSAKNPLLKSRDLPSEAPKDVSEQKVSNGAQNRVSASNCADMNARARALYEETHDPRARQIYEELVLDPNRRPGRGRENYSESEDEGLMGLFECCTTRKRPGQPVPVR